MCFCSFSLTEWGDPGQFAAAALVPRFHLTLATWLGASLALMLKGGLAITLGLPIRDRLAVRTLRILSSVSLLHFGNAGGGHPWARMCSSESLEVLLWEVSPDQYWKRACSKGRCFRK